MLRGTEQQILTCRKETVMLSSEPLLKAALATAAAASAGLPKCGAAMSCECWLHELTG